MSSYNAPAPVRLSWELAKDASHSSKLHQDLVQTSVAVSAELLHNSFHKHVPKWTMGVGSLIHLFFSVMPITYEMLSKHLLAEWINCDALFTWCLVASVT